MEPFAFGEWCTLGLEIRAFFAHGGRSDGAPLRPAYGPHYSLDFGKIQQTWPCFPVSPDAGQPNDHALRKHGKPFHIFLGYPAAFTRHYISNPYIVSTFGCPRYQILGFLHPGPPFRLEIVLACHAA